MDKTSATELRLEAAFFELEVGIGLAELALQDLLEVANDCLQKDYAKDTRLERGQLSVQAAEGGFGAEHGKGVG